MSKKTAPRIIIPFDLTDEMLPVLKAYAHIVIDEYRAQEREDYQEKKSAPELLTLEEAAAALKITKASLKRLRDAGDIQTTYVGPSVRISSKEIEKFHQSN